MLKKASLLAVLTLVLMAGMVMAAQTAADGSVAWPGTPQYQSHFGHRCEVIYCWCENSWLQCCSFICCMPWCYIIERCTWTFDCTPGGPFPVGSPFLNLL